MLNPITKIVNFCYSVVTRLKREIFRVVAPRIENRCAAVGNVSHISGGEVKVMLKRRRRQQCIDHRRRMAGEPLHLATDQLPNEALSDPTRREYAPQTVPQTPKPTVAVADEACLHRQVMDALLIFGNSENAQKQLALRLRCKPL